MGLLLTSWLRQQSAIIDRTVPVGNSARCVCSPGSKETAMGHGQFTHQSVQHPVTQMQGEDCSGKTWKFSNCNSDSTMSNNSTGKMTENAARSWLDRSQTDICQFVRSNYGNPVVNRTTPSVLHFRNLRSFCIPLGTQSSHTHPGGIPWRGVGGRRLPASSHGWVCVGWVSQWNADGTQIPKIQTEA